MKASTVILLGLLVVTLMACCHAEDAADTGKHDHKSDEEPGAKGHKIAAEKSGGKAGGKGKGKGRGKKGGGGEE